MLNVARAGMHPLKITLCLLFCIKYLRFMDLNYFGQGKKAGLTLFIKIIQYNTILALGQYAEISD
jgi:hypothetical protein